jgi:hypothetical protein
MHSLLALGLGPLPPAQVQSGTSELVAKWRQKLSPKLHHAPSETLHRHDATIYFGAESGSSRRVMIRHPHVIKYEACCC